MAHQSAWPAAEFFFWGGEKHALPHFPPIIFFSFSTSSLCCFLYQWHSQDWAATQLAAFSLEMTVTVSRGSKVCTLPTWLLQL